MENKSEKRSIIIDLNTAKKWFKLGGDLKKLVLTAFTEDEIVGKKVYNYDKLLKKFADKYPIGTIVWSNDGTDIYPNVIISEPFLEDIDYYTFSGINKKIVFKTKRICMPEIYDSEIKVYSEREFDTVSIQSYDHVDGFSYDKWKKDYIQYYTNVNERYSKIIEGNKEENERLNKGILENTNTIKNFDEIYDACLKEILKSDD